MRDRTNERIKRAIQRKTDPLFVAKEMYQKQKSRAKEFSYKNVGYSKEYFIEWIFEQGYIEMFNIWVASGNIKDLKPSVDRIDAKKGYIVGNIELLTWKDNNIKGRKENKTCNKPVVQLTKNGKFVAEYESAIQASMCVAPHLKSHKKSKIYLVLNKKRHYNTFYGYKFEYKEGCQ